MGTTRPFGPGCAVLRMCHYKAVRQVVLATCESERRPCDLRHRRGVARTTLYNHVAQLFTLGIVVKRESPGPPWRVFYELGPNGAEFYALLRAWADTLGYLPNASWNAPLHFAEAWAAGVVPTLVGGSLTKAQVIALCSHRATGAQVERLLRQLYGEGFLIRCGHRYTIADAARHAIGELAAAARFERRHMHADAASITVTDGINALRGALPLVTLPGYADGLCEFVVRATEVDPGPRAAACWAEIRAGRVIASDTGNAPSATTTWAQGTIEDWLAAIIDRRAALLRPAGERRLGNGVIHELHAQLYGQR